MKSMLIIGLGDFGHHLCRQLIRMKNEVMVVDTREEALEDLKDVVTGRLIADCTSKSALESVGVSNFDVCFVCIDSDFKTNLVVIDLLRELGARYVISQTEDDTMARFLLKNGADEIIYPNRDAAVRAAVKYSSEHIFDYVHLKDDYSIYEISPIKAWIGKSILSSKIRERYDTYIIGIQGRDGKLNMMPSPASVIHAGDHLTVLAHEKTIESLLRKM